MKKQYFARCFFPGFLFADYDDVEIPEPTLDKAIEKLSARADGFEIWQRDIIEEGDQIFKGDKQTLETYYIGKVKTFMEIAKEYSQDSVLYRNMLNNNIDRVVNTRSGGMWPLKENVKVLDSDNLRPIKL